MDKEKMLSEGELSQVTGGVKHDSVKLTGTVVEVLPNTIIRVELSNGSIIKTHVSGKMRMNCIKILPGEKVDVELSPYDRTVGRIVARYI